MKTVAAVCMAVSVFCSSRETCPSSFLAASSQAWRNTRTEEIMFRHWSWINVFMKQYTPFRKLVFMGILYRHGISNVNIISYTGITQNRVFIFLNLCFAEGYGIILALIEVFSESTGIIWRTEYATRKERESQCACSTAEEEWWSETWLLLLPAL